MCPVVSQGVYTFCNRADCPTSAATVELSSVLEETCQHCLVESGFRCKHLATRSLLYRLASAGRLFPHAFVPRLLYGQLANDVAVMYDVTCSSCVTASMSNRSCHHGQNMKLFFNVFELTLELHHTRHLFDDFSSELQEHFSTENKNVIRKLSPGFKFRCFYHCKMFSSPPIQTPALTSRCCFTRLTATVTSRLVRYCFARAA